MVSIDIRDAIVDEVLHHCLKQSAGPSDKTVVKGYYSTTNRLNTGDATTVKGKDIQKQPVTDSMLALEGQMLALYI
jgi:TonB-dependent starch-binding outer membrane protein SusC